jgi:hypothetical protein
VTHPHISNPFVAQHYLKDHPEIMSLEKRNTTDMICLNFKDPSVFYKHADEFAQRQERGPRFNNEMRESVAKRSGSFNECGTYDEYVAKRNAVDRDPRFELIAELTEKLTADLLRTGRFDMRKRGHDVYGDNPDVPRSISGDLMSMHLWKGKKQVNRLSLGVPFGGSCILDAKFLSNYGAAVAAMADALEHRGTRVRLITGNVDSGHGRAPNLRTEITLKEYSQQLDLGEIVQLWVQTDSFRRAWFTYVEMCTHPDWIRAYQVGYGRIEKYEYSGDELCVNLTPPDTMMSKFGNDASAALLADNLFPLVSKQEAA